MLDEVVVVGSRWHGVRFCPFLRHQVARGSVDDS